MNSHERVMIGTKQCNDSSTYVIHNYLKYPTKVKISQEVNRESIIDVASLDAHTSVSLTHLSRNSIESLFKPGNVINIYMTVYPNSAKEPVDILYSSHKLLHSDLWSPAREPINSLHIGQITTRAINTALTDRPVNSQGLGAILVHNLTNLPIKINDFVVPANSTFRWRGPLKYGIPLGSYFTDNSAIKMYPTWKLIRPITDIYYGMTSHNKQELYGGYNFSFDNHANNVDPYLRLTK